MQSGKTTFTRLGIFFAISAISLNFKMMPVFAVQNSATVTIVPTAAGGSGTFDQTILGGAPLDLSGSATGGSASSGNGSSHVEYGGIILSGAATGTIDTTVKGRFRDHFTITAPGIPTGTPGQLTFFMEIDGVTAATAGDTVITWNVQAAVAGFSGSIATGSTGSPDSASPGDSGSFLFGNYSRPASFQFGVPTSLDIELSATIAARLGITSEAGDGSFDFSPYVYWDGISGIFDMRPTIPANVSGAQLVSDSGTNWLESFTPPVPEPASGVMMWVGMMVMAGRRRSVGLKDVTS